MQKTPANSSWQQQDKQVLECDARCTTPYLTKYNMTMTAPTCEAAIHMTMTNLVYQVRGQVNVHRKKVYDILSTGKYLQMVLTLEWLGALAADVTTIIAVNKFVLCESTGVVERLAADRALNNWAATSWRSGRWWRAMGLWWHLSTLASIASWLSRA